MILLQAEKFQLDLSSYGVKLNEENSIFSDNIYKSYSLPFSIEADKDLLAKLDLPTTENVINVNQKIKCRILLNDKHLPATLYLGEMVKSTIECNLTYGDNELAVYDTELKDLPWPIIISPTPLQNFAAQKTMSIWPYAGYAFPMVYNPEIVDGENYDKFEGFVNNWDEDLLTYKTNEVIVENDEDGNPEDVYYNRNVMAPFPYFLEILKFGFAQEGKTIIGQLVNDPVFRKAVYAPDNYLEKFDGNEFQQISFSQRTSAETNNQNQVFNIYRTSFVPTKTGTYNLSLKLNIPPGLASVFGLKISSQNVLSGDLTTIKSYFSVGTRVNIEDKLSINVESSNQFNPIVVELSLKYTDVNIAEFNNFEFSYSGGQLSVFPQTFSLNNFMPDMKFGEFVNELKNWLNLDISITDNYVKLDFVQETVLQKFTRNHEHLELTNPTWKSNNNRFYKLSYENEEKVFYNKEGQVYSDLDVDGDDVIEINMDVQPLVVESNKNIITAVAPEDKSKLDFLIHDSSSPIVNPQLADALSLQNNFLERWITWLNFRVNSKSCDEDFECSVHEEIYKEELSHKYNELHIIKKLNKKYLSEKRMKVEIESETF